MELTRFLLTTLALNSLNGLSTAQKWTYDLPPEEEAALSTVVEDDHNDIVRVMKSNESPEYPLIYRNALPIPPVKKPLK